MQTQSLLSTKHIMPIALYSSKQLYAMEQGWFDQGNDSFGLMQQAAWQMAQIIVKVDAQQQVSDSLASNAGRRNTYNRQRRVSIWVGKGNNGGDGWLIAYYLQQMGWQVEVITIGFDKSDFIIKDDLISAHQENTQSSITDAEKSQQLALSANCEYQRFEDSRSGKKDIKEITLQADAYRADIYIDAVFGIGLNRAPDGIYKSAISIFNGLSERNNVLAIAVDIPSGLVASTGEVFERIAIQADITLCLIARKFGLHTKDGMDYSGAIIDIPLIPYELNNEQLLPVATLIHKAHGLKARRQNSYKGSYGHVLAIGGNRIDGSQGMGGAAILSASSAMATGAGKITVACHEAFHGALLTSLPDAMTIDLHDNHGVSRLIKEASVVAIGMGLGRDKKAEALFINYIQTVIAEKKPIVIDADGLYHLASLQVAGDDLIVQLKVHSTKYQVCLTPHSGEAARLLDKTVLEVEADRLAAIKQCAAMYGGDWVLKGAGSLILEQKLKYEQIYVCGVGNAGMATAGMGDVLSGVIAGLLAQQDLEKEPRSLHQAVVIHGLAGDKLVNQIDNEHSDNKMLLIGQRGLQAQDMPAAIRHVMQSIIHSK